MDNYTPEQLNAWANQIAMHDYNYASPTKADIEEQLRAHAATLDKIRAAEEALNATDAYLSRSTNDNPRDEVRAALAKLREGA